uniref:Transposase Tnp1/En/Spm-like domain-containing protein n=1 Tax=Ananas comosus var. bracteatus TaxID=296719 RepID=A0A6V7Q6D2_ANACO|nr:unnamed protein product [Ananas comosus var. bracteatus]
MDVDSQTVDQPTNSIRETIGELQEEETEQDDQRRVRGPTLLTEIWNLSEEERIVVDFNKRWQAVGTEGRVLASFLGIVARNANLTPLHIPDWRSFPMKEKKNILKLVKSKFSIPTRGEKWVLRSLGKKWKDYKCHLKSEYYLKYKNVDDLLENRPERVPRDQWTTLVSFWNSEKVKKRSEKNRENRGKQKMPHTAGSKSFARLTAEKTKDGAEPSRAHIFIETHKPRKDGRPIDNESLGKVNLIMEKIEKLPNSTEHNDRGHVAWEGDIYSQVIGEERHGQVPLPSAESCFARVECGMSPSLSGVLGRGLTLWHNPLPTGKIPDHGCTQLWATRWRDVCGLKAEVYCILHSIVIVARQAFPLGGRTHWEPWSWFSPHVVLGCYRFVRERRGGARKGRSSVDSALPRRPELAVPRLQSLGVKEMKRKGDSVRSTGETLSVRHWRRRDLDQIGGKSRAVTQLVYTSIQNLIYGILHVIFNNSIHNIKI